MQNDSVITGPSGQLEAQGEFNIGDGPANCPSGQLCLWAGYNFHEPGSASEAGALASPSAIPDLGKLTKEGALYYGMQDVASSAYNTRAATGGAATVRTPGAPRP
ncbi:peptidase inhibitor family I36 protein [Streptomyces tendae]